MMPEGFFIIKFAPQHDGKTFIHQLLLIEILKSYILFKDM